MDAKGDGETPLPFGPFTSITDPTFSPDGTQIAFTGRTSGSGSTPVIGVMNANGTGHKTLASGGSPSWSIGSVPSPPAAAKPSTSAASS